MTDAERLTSIGEALYGRTWQAQIASLLDVDPRRVRQWLSGDRPIPVGAWPELRAELRLRGKSALALADRLTV
ncbi:MAG: hypothetical protein ABL901_14195 [Hyphomicrobiaceae bacterium]